MNCNYDCISCDPQQYESVHGVKLESSNRGIGISYSQKVKELVRDLSDCNTDENFNQIYKDEDENILYGSYGSLTQCGDQTDIYIKLNNDIIEDIKFECSGCYGALSSSIYLCKLLKGTLVKDFNIPALSEKIMTNLELPENKKHCGIYPVLATKDALNKGSILKENKE